MSVFSYCSESRRLLQFLICVSGCMPCHVIARVSLNSTTAVFPVASSYIASSWHPRGDVRNKSCVSGEDVTRMLRGNCCRGGYTKHARRPFRWQVGPTHAMTRSIRKWRSYGHEGWPNSLTTEASSNACINGPLCALTQDAWRAIAVLTSAKS